jgi:phospholipid/cholesterol/gamma-HCH transport system substrate-binding protein
MSRNVVETILGAVVLIVAIGFGAWAYGRSNLGDSSGYELRAQFDRADGLDVGADVRISGIKVGRVLAQSLDQETYRAEVTFSVRNGIELPADSSAAIMSASLLGGKFLAIVPGGDDKMLKNGEEITLTQSAVNLEDLIGKFIYGSASGGGGGSGGGAAPDSGGGTPPAGAGQAAPQQ